MPLKYLQIETTSVCNQRCFFCPVSKEKRAKSQLSIERINKIITGLRHYPIETISISGFNEPTLDKQLIEKITAFRQAKLAVHLYTNGSGLTPALTDELLKAGVSNFTINLSTLDETQYQKTRGTKNIKNIAPHLHYLLAQIQKQHQKVKATVLVLGKRDEQHGTNIQMITKKFAEFTVPQIIILPLAEFAGKSTHVLPKRPYHKTLRGCAENRPNQWLHFTATGEAIFCCHDYFAQYKMGHIDESTIAQIYQGEKVAQWRRWITGKEEAPKDFLCRQCVFALTDENYAQTVQRLFCQSCLLPKILGNQNTCQRCGVNSYL